MRRRGTRRNGGPNPKPDAGEQSTHKAAAAAMVADECTTQAILSLPLKGIKRDWESLAASIAGITLSLNVHCQSLPLPNTELAAMNARR